MVVQNQQVLIFLSHLQFFLLMLLRDQLPATVEQLRLQLQQLAERLHTQEQERLRLALVFTHTQLLMPTELQIQHQ